MLYSSPKATSDRFGFWIRIRFVSSHTFASIHSMCHTHSFALIPLCGNLNNNMDYPNHGTPHKSSRSVISQYEGHLTFRILIWSPIASLKSVCVSVQPASPKSLLSVDVALAKQLLSYYHEIDFEYMMQSFKEISPSSSIVSQHVYMPNITDTECWKPWTVLPVSHLAAKAATNFISHMSFWDKTEMERGWNSKMQRIKTQDVTGSPIEIDRRRTDSRLNWWFSFLFIKGTAAALRDRWEYFVCSFYLFLLWCFPFFFSFVGKGHIFIQSSNLKWSNAFVLTSWKFPFKVFFLFSYFLMPLFISLFCTGISYLFMLPMGPLECILAPVSS